MRIALLLLLAGCAAKEVPLVHLEADSRETAEEAAAAVAKSGVRVRLVAVADLEEVPEWVGPGEGGFVLVGRAGDRERAERALDKWFDELRARSAERPPAPGRFVLGTRTPGAGEVEAIRAELARRLALDQAVRKDPRRRGEMAPVDTDNTAYLRGLAADVGWIDVARFGRPAADAAFLLVQHSGDLPLMRAALPEIGKDVRAGAADPQLYALLHDRTGLMGGGDQRYGTQVLERSGDLVVPRLEDPDRVDERRKDLGLGPLADYLAGFGRDVRIEPAPAR